MLRVNNISKSFNRKKVLVDISFSQRDGESIAFMGKNGTGKSTLFRIIAGLMTYDLGSITFKENDLNKAAFHRNKLFYLGHAPGMYHALSSIENLNFALKLRNIYLDQKEILKALDDYGLIKAIKDPIGFYSAGMLQRLKIVCAKLIKWDMILIDEPFSSLDNDGIDMVQKEILEWREKNKTIAMVLHQKSHAEQFCDRILNIESGIIKEI